MQQHHCLFASQRFAYGQYRAHVEPRPLHRRLHRHHLLEAGRPRAISECEFASPGRVLGPVGQSGERWTPQSRLPDFSFAGYRTGNVAIPNLPVVTNVKSYGAVGDGVADDTQAFINAIAATSNGAVSIPAGRYKITEVIKINKSNVVLRGAGSGSTTLLVPGVADRCARQRAKLGRQWRRLVVGRRLPLVEGQDKRQRKLASVTSGRCAAPRR